MSQEKIVIIKNEKRMDWLRNLGLLGSFLVVLTLAWLAWPGGGRAERGGHETQGALTHPRTALAAGVHAGMAAPTGTNGPGAGAGTSAPGAGALPKFAAEEEQVVRREQGPSADGTRQILVQVVRRPTFKYPLVRIEESYAQDPNVRGPGPVTRQEMVADHLVVTLKPETDAEQVLSRINSANPSFQCSLRKKMIFGKNVVLIAFDGMNPKNMAAVKGLLARDRGVALSEPDYIVRTSERVPDDTRFPDMWNLKNTGQTGGAPGADINATYAWDVGVGTDTVVVAVIDTGVDYRHPDLSTNMWRNPGEIAGNGVDDDGNGLIDDVYGYDFCNTDGDPLDDFFHGTHCAGTIGAVGNNSLGVVGVNWRVKLLALKFLSNSGSGAISDAAECVRYATQLKLRGINIRALSNSWGTGGGGGPEPGSDMYNAIVEARDAGILFVIAAGNDGVNHETTPYYPADYELDNIICVAATDHNDALAAFSSYGSNHVHLAAPGVAIWSTTPTNDTPAMLTARGSYPDLLPSYGKISGTSMATPHVAGACAWVWAVRPELTYAQVRSQILSSVKPLPALQGKTSTGGRLDLFAASPPVTAYLLMPAWRVDDSSGGNADGILNAGETVAIFPTVWNFGAQTATQVVASLSLGDDAYLTLTQTNATFGDLAPNQKMEPPAGFGLEVAALTPSGHTVTGKVSIAIAGGGHWQYPLVLSVWTSSSIQGHVYDAEAGGAGRGGASIRYRGPVSGSVTSTIDGAYAIAPLIDGAYALTVTYPGRVPETNTVSIPPAQTGVDFLLTDPDLVVQPTNVAVTVNQGMSTSVVVVVSNNGTGALICDGIEPGLWVSWYSCSDTGFTIPAGESRSLTLSFSPGNADPTTLTDTLKLYSNDPQLPVVSLPISLTIASAPIISLGRVATDDTVGGDGDGYLEPGESASLMMTMENNGKLAASGLSVTFTNDPYLTITSAPTVVVGTLSAVSGSTGIVYRVTASAATPAGYTAVLPGYSVDSAGRRWTHAARVPVMARYSVTGQVKQLGSGMPLTNAWIYCVGETTSAQSGSNGVFNLYGLADGSHSVFAVLGGRRSSTAAITVPPLVTGLELAIDFAGPASFPPWGMPGGQADRGCRGVGVGPVEFKNVTSYTGTVCSAAQAIIDSDGTIYTKYGIWLMAHDPDGNERWKLTGPKGFGGLDAAPVIGLDGALFMAASGYSGPTNYLGVFAVSKDGRIVASKISANADEYINNGWTKQRNPVLMPNGNLLIYKNYSDSHYVLPAKRTLECYAPDLQLVWRKDFTESFSSEFSGLGLGFAVGQDNTVYATVGDTVYKLDANGQEVAKAQYKNLVRGDWMVNNIGGACNPVVNDDTVFVCLMPVSDPYMFEGWIIALDKNTLVEKWRRIFTDVSGPNNELVTMALGPYGESLFLGFRLGEGAAGGKPPPLVKLNATTGDTLWNVTVNRNNSGVDNRLEQLIVDRNGNVFCYVVEDGIMSVTGGTVRGYDGRDGALLWISDSVPTSSGISQGADGAIYQAMSVLWSGAVVYRRIAGETTPPTNTPPVALGTVSAPTNAVGQTVTFSGAGSSDSDGWIAKRFWNFGDGTPTVEASATTGRVQRAYGRPGDFVATLTIQDNRGLLNHARIPVHVTGNGPSGQATPTRLDVVCAPGSAVTQAVALANTGDPGCQNLDLNVIAVTTNAGQVAFTTRSGSDLAASWLTPADNGKFWLCSGLYKTTYKLFDPMTGTLSTTCSVAGITEHALKAGWDGTNLWFATYKTELDMHLHGVNPANMSSLKTLPGPWHFQTDHHRPVLTTYGENALWVADTSFRQTRICKLNPSNGAVLREIVVLIEEMVMDFEYVDGFIWLWGHNGVNGQSDAFYMVDARDGSVLWRVALTGPGYTGITRGPNGMVWRRQRVTNYFYELTSLGVAPWLKPNPATGSVTGQTAQACQAAFNSTGLSNGVYAADLLLLANDDNSLTAHVPVTMTVGEFWRLIVASAGNGTVVPGVGAYYVPAGNGTNVVAVAGEWHRVQSLTTNGAAIAAADGVKGYTQTVTSLTANVTNTVAVTFTQPATLGGPFGTVPTAWLSQWGTEAYVRDNLHTNDYNVGTKYLLNVDPTTNETVAFRMDALAVSGAEVAVVAKLLVNEAVHRTLYGTVRLYGCDVLSNDCWAAAALIASTNVPPPGAVFDADGKVTFTFSLGQATNRFYQGRIE